MQRRAKQNPASQMRGEVRTFPAFIAHEEQLYMYMYVLAALMKKHWYLQHSKITGKLLYTHDRYTSLWMSFICF